MSAHPFEGPLAFGEASAERTRKALAHVLDEVQRRILLLVGGFDVDPRTERFKTTKAQLGVLESKRREIDELLIRAGYGSAVRSLFAVYPELGRRVERAWRELKIPVAFRAIDHEAFAAAIDVQQSRFAQLGGAAVETIREHLAQAVTIGDDIEGFRARLTDVLIGEGGVDRAGRGLFRYASVYASDSISQLNRLMNMRLSEQAGVERWQWWGGLIPSSRALCRRLDGQILTREQLDAISAERGYNVFATMGGPLCRHVLVPVLDESPLSVELAESYAAAADEQRAALDGPPPPTPLEAEFAALQAEFEMLSEHERAMFQPELDAVRRALEATRR